MRSSFALAALGVLATAVVASPIGGYPTDSASLAPLYTPPCPQPPSWDISDDLSQDMPFEATASGESHLIPDSYIVVYKRHVQPHHHDAHKRRVARIQASDAQLFDGVSSAGVMGIVHDYGVEGALRGYSGRFTERVIDSIRAQPEVAYVERDSRVWASDTEKGAPWVCSGPCPDLRRFC
jgi:cerevisin